MKIVNKLGLKIGIKDQTHPVQKVAAMKLVRHSGEIKTRWPLGIFLNVKLIIRHRPFERRPNKVVVDATF